MIFERRIGRDILRDETPIMQECQENCMPIERIIFLVMDDPSTRWIAFLSGMLDIDGEISRDNWDAVITSTGALSPKLAQQGIRLETKPSLDTYYIAFNMDDPVVGNNKKLRQAMSCAFNVSQWIEINRGRIEQARGPIPPGIDEYPEKVFEYGYNLNKAKTLLSEAGYENGIDPKTKRRLVLTLDLGRTDQETRESAELFASFMSTIGIVVNLQYNNWPSFLRKVVRREAQMFMLGWIADYPDPLNFLQLFVERNSSPGPNRSNYNNSEYDALFDIAASASTDDKRNDAINKMINLLYDDMPWIFLHHRKDNVLLHRSIQNHRLHDFPYGMEKHWRKRP